MLKAYDTFLHVEVFANEAAKNGVLEPNRYICAHCGEDVILAAVNSIYVKPYFKHRHGNNNVECEEYCGHGKIRNYSSRLDKNTRAEFYFDKNTKLFYLGIAFSEEEINALANNDTLFELRTHERGKAIIRVRVDNQTFAPDVPRFIPIEIFSYDYYLSNTYSNTGQLRQVFRRNGSVVPTFFKIQGNDSCYRAKLVRSDCVYTNVPYFIVYQEDDSFQRYKLPNEIVIEESFSFRTMGRRFHGMRITIPSRTAAVDLLLTLWGYHLKESESLVLLWPPAITKNEIVTVRTSSVHLFSSFTLDPYVNINAKSGDIKRLAKGVSRVQVNSRVFIRKANAELVIERVAPWFVDHDTLSVSETRLNVFQVPERFDHFLFDSTGGKALSYGQTIYLTPGSYIRRYQSTYCDSVIYPKQHSILSGEELLVDILKHYKVVEVFSIEHFRGLELSDVAARYIAHCASVGYINSAAKCFIQEGWL